MTNPIGRGGGRRCWWWVVALLLVASCESAPPDHYVVVLRDGTSEDFYAEGMVALKWGRVLCTHHRVDVAVCWPLDSVKEWRRVH